jgi:hypothetical protein
MVGTRVELFLPIVAGASACEVHRERDIDTTDPLAGGAMLWLHGGPMSQARDEGRPRASVGPWTGNAEMKDSSRACGGKGVVYAV